MKQKKQKNKKQEWRGVSLVLLHPLQKPEGVALGSPLLEGVPNEGNIVCYFGWKKKIAT